MALGPRLTAKNLCRFRRKLHKKSFIGFGSKLAPQQEFKLDSFFALTYVTICSNILWVNLIKLFGINLLTLACKLGLFMGMQQI